MTASSPTTPAPSGAGLGLRRELMGALSGNPNAPIDFLEVAPENWIGIGGRQGRQFRALTERHPFIAHGLSLSIGSPAPLDEAFLKRLKVFLDQHGIAVYSEHLSYCSDTGHLYDLMPIPFTEEAVHYVAERLRRVQDVLERPVAMENISYYAAPGQAMSEQAFVLAVLEEAVCPLLLDVNNVYVNSINHGYDACAFIAAMPAERIAYLHVAGHYREAADLVIDSHGAPVIDPVWDLLSRTYERFGPLPTLLERDFNIPPLTELLEELAVIRRLQDRACVPELRHG
ncbi:MAG TPA: DUF692 domain-containing protein [Gammaproteobacteria bacterium]|nr:DUF692 domain-containing protein [Gammaproteobacteria bacterium]